MAKIKRQIKLLQKPHGEPDNQNELTEPATGEMFSSTKSKIENEKENDTLFVVNIPDNITTTIQDIDIKSPTIKKKQKDPDQFAVKPRMTSQ